MRSLWKGNLSFVLLNMAVKIYKATEEKKGKFRMLHKECHTPMNMKRWCSKCNRELQWPELEKGFVLDEERVIVFTDEEVASLTEGTSPKTIRITESIDNNKIDTAAYGQFYYISPEKGFERIYLLLKEALRDTNKSLLGLWTYRGKEYFICVQTHNGILTAVTLKYADEIRSMSELPAIDTKETPSAEEIKLGAELVNKFTNKEFKLPESSSYEKRFALLLSQKSMGALKVETPPKVIEPPKPKDLMLELRASLEAAKPLSEVQVPQE